MSGCNSLLITAYLHSRKDTPCCVLRSWCTLFSKLVLTGEDNLIHDRGLPEYNANIDVFYILLCIIIIVIKKNEMNLKIVYHLYFTKTFFIGTMRLHMPENKNDVRKYLASNKINISFVIMLRYKQMLTWEAFEL